MSAPLVTLTTDFGPGSSYVAAMKGALLARTPQARLIDLSHAIPPQDVEAAARFLCEAVPWYPGGTTHVVVVDPGVGTERAILCVEWQRQRLLVPDNGCWTPLVESSVGRPRVVEVSVARFWHHDVAPTFHGRDIFAPVAAALCNGLPPDELGQPAKSWMSISLPRPTFDGGALRGVVVAVDRFGNLLSNIHTTDLHALGLTNWSAQVAGRPVPHRVTTYGQAPPGTLVALVSSSGVVEIAVVNGSAAEQLGLGRGSAVEVGPALAGAAPSGKTSEL
jgi:hypothetical protein